MKIIKQKNVYINMIIIIIIIITYKYDKIYNIKSSIQI